MGTAPTAASDDPDAACGLFGLPGALLEAILLLLPLKLRARFTTTCKAARNLGTFSPVLWHDVRTSCFGHQQSLYLLRWLAAAPRRVKELEAALHFQGVVPTRRLSGGLAMQAATLEVLVLSVHDGPLFIGGSWLAQLRRLRSLEVAARGVELGSCCGTLPALQELLVSCAFTCAHDASKTEHEPTACTTVVHPGAIPSGLTSMDFTVCTLPELPAALTAAASNLKRLFVDGCAVDLGSSDFSEERAPDMQVLSQLTALTSVQLSGMQLDVVPPQLAAAAGLQRLVLRESTFGWQASMSTLSQLPNLDRLRLHYTEDWVGEPAHEVLGGGANMGDLPQAQVQDLTVIFEAGCPDKRLPHLASLPRLRHLEVSANALLCSGNAAWLRELDRLEGLHIIFPECPSEAGEVMALGAEGLLAMAQDWPELNRVSLIFPRETAGVLTRKLLHGWRRQLKAALPGLTSCGVWSIKEWTA